MSNAALEILKSYILACDHKALTKRFATAMQTATGRTVTLYQDKSYTNRAQIRFWYAENQHIEVSCYLNDTARWQDQFVTMIERMFTYDQDERLLAEQALYPALTEIEAQIVRLRAEAERLIAELPVPKSATVRADEAFWNSPRHETVNRFPLAFKS